MAHFEIEGSTGFVVTDEGERIPISTIVTEACKDAGAIMDEYHPQQGGNLSVGFSRKYFPRRGEIDGAGRSKLNAAKARAQLAIYDRMIELGIPAEDMTFSEGYQGRNGWQSVKRIFFNKPNSMSRAQSNDNALSSLKKEYMALGGDISQYKDTTEMAEGDEDILVGWLKHQVKVLKAQADTKAVEAEVGANVPEADGEVPDTGDL